MPVKSNWTPFFSGLAVGSLLALSLTRKESHYDRLPARAIWQRTLGREIGEVPAALTIGKVQARYHTLLRDRPYFDHPALRRHLEGSILPGLALYLVLKEETGDEAGMEDIPSLVFERSNTIGRGGAVCDFCYRKAN